MSAASHGWRGCCARRATPSPPAIGSRATKATPIWPPCPVSDFDQLWLFAVDVTDAITPADALAVQAFRRRGGGVFVTRDHQDLGRGLLRLGRLGRCQHFHSDNQEPAEDRHACDDTETPSIDWPNYNTGRNGDFQTPQMLAPDHPVLRGPNGGTLRTLPSHPHEGVVSRPADAEGFSTVLMCGESQITGRHFNLAIAFEGEPDDDGTVLGRAVANSSFHHLADYNWNPSDGAPSFVTEAPGDAIVKSPEAQADAQAYARNLGAWLS